MSARGRAALPRSRAQGPERRVTGSIPSGCRLARPFLVFHRSVAAAEFGEARIGAAFRRSLGQPTWAGSSHLPSTFHPPRAQPHGAPVLAACVAQSSSAKDGVTDDPREAAVAPQRGSSRWRRFGGAGPR